MALPAGVAQLGTFQGNGVRSSVTRYAVAGSGVVAPTEGWTASIPNVPDEQYLWTRLTITMTDDTTSVSYAVSRRGPAGPPVPSDQLATAVETALAATGRLSDLGVSIGTGNPLTDLDEVPAESGFYRVFSTASNRPPGGFTGPVLHLAHSSTAAVQIGVPVGENMSTDLWVRVRKAGTFEAWQKLPTTDDVAAALTSRVEGLVAELGLATATAVSEQLDERVEGLVAELELPTVATIASVDGRWDDLDQITSVLPVSLDVRNTAAHRPVADGTRWTGWHIPTGDGASQILVSLSSPPRVFVRAKTGGAWTAWDDTILGNDPRAMRLGRLDSVRIVDALAKVAFRVGSDGRTFAPDFEARRAKLGGLTIVESADGSVSLKDQAGKVAWRVGTDGRTLIGDLDPRSNMGTVAAVDRIDQVLVLLEWGQSNAAGRAKPINARRFPPHSRILMAQWDNTTVTGITRATVPVSSQSMGETSGLDPATVIARRIVAEQPNTLVVICNTAKGGSAVVLDTSNGVWGVDYTGTNRHLLPIAKAAISTTLAHVGAQYPGIPVDVWCVGHQGESDGGQLYAVYKPAVQGVLEDFRSHIGDPTMPIVMGGTVPEVSDPDEEANIMAAQIQLQGDMEHFAWVPGIPNGGGSSAPTGDTVHYNLDGMLELGDNMHDGLLRACVASADSNPLPPLKVTGRWRSTVGILDIAWSMPSCHSTAFVVQYRQSPSSSWTTITGRPRELDPVAHVTGLTGAGEIEVRVATVNGVGQSAFTTPVTAIGA